MPLEGCPVDVFRQHIGHVLLAGDLFKLEFAAPEFVLNPEVCSGEVTDLSQSSPSADPYGGRGIRKHSERPR